MFFFILFFFVTGVVLANASLDVSLHDTQHLISVMFKFYYMLEILLFAHSSKCAYKLHQQEK
jgi:heme/copper-type cytochrome/quinol oxidase subunit 1